MKTDPHDIDPQKQKGRNHITEEEREEALIELMAKIIVDKIVRENPKIFPNETIQGNQMKQYRESKAGSTPVIYKNTKPVDQSNLQPKRNRLIFRIIQPHRE